MHINCYLKLLFTINQVVKNVSSKGQVLAFVSSSTPEPLKVQRRHASLHNIFKLTVASDTNSSLSGIR
jgi:hypothetical protein